MEATLSQRIDIFRSMPEIPDSAVDLVTDELALIDPEEELTDKQAGMFVSHAVNALARLLRQEPEADAPSQAVYAEVLNESPGALNLAHAMADRVKAATGQELPTAEVQFMTIHFAALQRHLGKDNQ